MPASWLLRKPRPGPPSPVEDDMGQATFSAPAGAKPDSLVSRVEVFRARQLPLLLRHGSPRPPSWQHQQSPPGMGKLPLALLS